MNKRSIIALSTLSSALVGTLVLFGCKNLNMDAIGDAVGGSTGAYIKSAGHAGNALAMNETDEPALGQSIGVALTDQYGVDPDVKLRTYVNYVGLTLNSQSPVPGGNCLVAVLDTDEINAFSGPAGYVFITRGLLKQIKNEAELAGVLGHELTHVNLHHGLDAAKESELSKAAQQAVAANDPKGQFNLGADGVLNLVTGQYSQPQEFAADEGGVRLMTAAGYDPHAYLALLQRLSAMQAGGATNVMSSHPDITDRINKVKSEIDGMNNPGGAILAERFAENVKLN